VRRAARPALLALAGLAVGVHGRALAQSERYPPPPVDVDDRAAASSAFWERVLHSGGRSFELHVAAARTRLEQPSGHAAVEALEHLDQAVALAPDHPEGHWLRAVAAERVRRWRLCAASYARVLAIDPAYMPALAPPGRDPAWALDAGLGLCLAQDGDYEGALTHFKRIAGRAPAAEVHVFLAETYVALGRLAEAIDVLALFSRQQASTARVEHVLAAAYDRREMPEQAREHLRAALRLGPLGLLDAPDQVFIPAEEYLYYLGLAFIEHGEAERALLSFRHYLHFHGKGPWRRRAEHHAERLARAGRSPRSITISNPGGVDPAAVRAAIDQAEAGLQSCVRQLPGVLFSVRLTRLQEGKDAPSRGRAVTLGVETQAVQSVLGDPEEVVAEAQRCLEAAAQGVALPRARGQAGGYMTVTFPVIAR
jgi:tetratricopeptide (TPR) repeat protein